MYLITSPEHCKHYMYLIEYEYIYECKFIFVATAEYVMQSPQGVTGATHGNYMSR